MLKFVGTDIVFQEFPDEVTLAINISNCPCRCPGCHSPFLWKDTGTELTEASMHRVHGRRFSSRTSESTCRTHQKEPSRPKNRMVHRSNHNFAPHIPQPVRLYKGRPLHSTSWCTEQSNNQPADVSLPSRRFVRRHHSPIPDKLHLAQP